MTESAIEAILTEAMRRFAIRAARVVIASGAGAARADRLGSASRSAHRGTAFAACEFLMDYLKTQAPSGEGDHRCRRARVDAREADDAALARWGIDTPNA